MHTCMHTPNVQNKLIQSKTIIDTIYLGWEKSFWIVNRLSSNFMDAIRKLRITSQLCFLQKGSVVACFSAATAVSIICKYYTHTISLTHINLMLTEKNAINIQKRTSSVVSLTKLNLTFQFTEHKQNIIYISSTFFF